MKTVNSGKTSFNVGRICESELKSRLQLEIKVTEHTFHVYTGVSKRYLHTKYVWVPLHGGVGGW